MNFPPFADGPIGAAMGSAYPDKLTLTPSPAKALAYARRATTEARENPSSFAADVSDGVEDFCSSHSPSELDPCDDCCASILYLLDEDGREDGGVLRSIL